MRGGSATPNLFEVTRAPAMLGRTFTPADTAGGTSDVIVIGHGLWQRRFGGAPDIIGRSVQVNGRARTVIGVMPASFRLPNDYCVAAADRSVGAGSGRSREPRRLGQPIVYGSRAAAGRRVTPAAASSELPVVADRWVKAGYVRARPDGSLGGLARRVIPVAGVHHRRRARRAADPARLGRRSCC